MKIPVVVWGIIVATLVVVPLRIIGFGYLPSDDALRHAAKAVSGKTWPEILLLRPEITVDHNPGWHVLLTALHHHFHWDPWTLVAVSLVTLFILVAGAPLPWLRRPEAWFVSFATVVLVFPYFAVRVMLGRPM